MRKLQDSDRMFIKKMRTDMSEEYEWTGHPHESTIDESDYLQFHSEFLKHHRVRKIKLLGSRVVPRTDKQKQHTEYNIQVTTDELEYRVDRRFREFYALFKNIKKWMPSNCSFPKKNYNPFLSSVSPNIIQERINKLDMFLREALQEVLAHKDPTVTLRLFSFIELKETYEDKYTLGTVQGKSNSEKGQGQLLRFQSFRGHSSEKSGNSYSQNSLEMYIILMNEPNNAGKHLQKLDEIIKNKKYKATSEEIKLIFLGFDEYQGVLKFGVTNPLESNRVGALEILVDLLLPERNILFEKYERVLEKLSVQLWMVGDINYFDNPVFKVLYFRLLCAYCEKGEKEKSQPVVLKKLFLFHENLMNDYFHWKQMNYKGTKIRRANSRSMPNHLSSSWSDRLSLQSNSTSQTTELVEHELEDIRIWYHQPKNILVLKLKTERSIEEVKKRSFNWSSFVESYELEEFSEHYRYVMQNKGRKWILKLKVDMELLGKEAKEGKETDPLKRTVLPEEFEEEVQQAISGSRLRINREQSLFDYYPDYQEEIWVQETKTGLGIVILVKVARDVDILKGSIRPYAGIFAQDAVNSFS